MAGPDWDKLYVLAEVQQGNFTAKQAEEAGYSPQLLQKYLRANRIARVRRGIYRLVHHLTLPLAWKKRRLRVPARVTLYYKNLLKPERTWVGAVPVTTVARTLSDCLDANVTTDTIRAAIRDVSRRGLLGSTEVHGRMTRRTPMTRMILAAVVASSLLLACGGNSGGADVPTDTGGEPSAFLVGAVPATAPAAQPLTVTFEVHDALGRPVSGAQAAAAIELGGGTVSPAETTTGTDGRGQFTWTLGRVPVSNRLLVSGPGGGFTAVVTATLATPYAPETFGDVEAMLTKEKFGGSTEGLAFRKSDAIMMGVSGEGEGPGTLLSVDAQGKSTLFLTSGDALAGPLGLAYDSDGVLWICDTNGKALTQMTPDGKLGIRMSGTGPSAVAAPNAVAVDRQGLVWFSDPCLSQVIRFNPKDKTSIVAATMKPTQGGPNGVGFDEGGKYLYFTTENTVLFCGAQAGIELTDPVAGLYRLPIDEHGDPGPMEAVAEGVALFGDGLAFDAEGNLYALFDTVDAVAVAFEESALWVLPKGGSKMVKFLATQDRILANLQWGRGTFGDRTIYLSLLAVPPFALNERGLVKFDLGIQGLALP